MKHIRKRIDGRWEWRKTIDGKTHSIISKTQKQLLKKIKTFKPNTEEKQINKNFIYLIDIWYKTYKEKQIKSFKTYRNIINKYFKNNKTFKKDINKIVLQELQEFLNNIKGHRVAKYCYFVIKGVYFTALKNDIIKKDISLFIDIPKNKTIKGTAFTLEQQKLIYNNLDKSKMKYEVLFYLLTGCRTTEGVNVKLEDINFDKNTIYINGTKTKSAKRYVTISEIFKNILKDNFKNMFIYKSNYYSRTFTTYLKSLNIKNKCLYDLRHTYSTNLYYLDVKDKQRQYYMGHSSIVMTNDVYTTLDPTTSKADILNLYEDLYPNFD